MSKGDGSDTSDSGAPLSTEEFCRWALKHFGPMSVSAEAISDFAELHPELDSKLSEELLRYGVACGKSVLIAAKMVPVEMLCHLMEKLRSDANVETAGVARGLMRACDLVQQLVDVGEELARQRAKGEN